LKLANDWLCEVDSTALQSSLKDLEYAYCNFFRRVKLGDNPGFPRFKSVRCQIKSYKSKNNFNTIEVREHHIKLPKLGLVRTAISKKVHGRILNATVSLTPSGKYFLSLCCTDVSIPLYPKTGVTVGLDMGIKNLLVTSDGVIYPNHRYVKQSERKLAKAQRQLSRKSKGSNNRKKARQKVAKIHEKIANQRSDALHKLTTQIVKEYDIICVEDLAIKNMLKTHRLAKSISDASWGKLNRQLEYKSRWHNKSYVKVGRFYPSSQLCISCGYQNSAVMDLSLREWACPACGVIHDRDINAAKTILKEGLRLIA